MKKKTNRTVDLKLIDKEIIALGEKALGNAFETWLKMSNFAFGSRRPFDVGCNGDWASVKEVLLDLIRNNEEYPNNTYYNNFP